MAAAGFEFDARTMKAIEGLKKVFGVDSSAAVIRKSLALAQIMAKQADDEHIVLVMGKDEPVKISLAE